MPSGQHASKSEATPEPCNITEKDFLRASQARLRAETALEEKLEEVERLHTLLRDIKQDLCGIKHENSNLKLQLKETQEELKETQALFGKAVVAATRQNKSSNAVAGPPSHSDTSLKRVRSPSLEIIEAPPSSREKGKNKAGPEIPPTPSTPSIIRKQNRVLYANVPPTRSPLKIEHLLPTQPFNSSLDRDQVSGYDTNREAKRPKFEHATNEQKTTGSGHSSTMEIVVASKGKEPAIAATPQSTATTTTVVSSSSVGVGTWNAVEYAANGKTAAQSGNNADGEIVVMLKRMMKPAIAPAATLQSTAKPPPLASSSSAAAPPRNAPASSSKTELKPKQTIKTRDVFSLPSSINDLYMQSAPTLQITPPPIDLEVPRAFLRVAYAGSDQHFIQQFPADKNPSGPTIRRLVFPKLDMNPLMPSEPGENGFVFASRHEILYDPPWTLFCKLPNATRALWKYFGEYENELCGVMTAEQFRSQKFVVKQEWAKVLMKMKLFDCYVSMRSRIALRKAGLIPLEDKEEEKKIIEKEMCAVKRDRGHPVNQDDIIQAFSRGDEAIDIIRMTCVQYDHVFANDMKAKFPEYPRLLAESKAKRKMAKSKKSKLSRARDDDDDDDDDNNDHDDDNDDDDDVDDLDAGRTVPTSSARAAAKTTKTTNNQPTQKPKDCVDLSSIDDVSDYDFQIIESSANQENEDGGGNAPSRSSPRRLRPRRSSRRKPAAANLAARDEIEEIDAENFTGVSDDDDVMDLDYGC